MKKLTLLSLITLFILSACSTDEPMTPELIEDPNEQHGEGITLWNDQDFVIHKYQTLIDTFASNSIYPSITAKYFDGNDITVSWLLNGKSVEDSLQEKQWVSNFDTWVEEHGIKSIDGLNTGDELEATVQFSSGVAFTQKMTITEEVQNTDYLYFNFGMSEEEIRKIEDSNLYNPLPNLYIASNTIYIHNAGYFLNAYEFNNNKLTSITVFTSEDDKLSLPHLDGLEKLIAYAKELGLSSEPTITDSFAYYWNNEKLSFKLCSMDEVIEYTGIKGYIGITISEYEYIETTGIELDVESFEIEKGTSQKVNASLLPTNASPNNIKWSSSNENIAIVDENGYVTAISTGVANITATTENGNFTASCQVTVTPIPVSDISFSAIEYYMLKGEVLQLNPIITPANADNQNITWDSDNNNIISVDENGNVTALSNGEASIIAKTEDGGFVASCRINVVPTIIMKDLKLSISSSSIVNMNGYCTGSLYSRISNNNNVSITLTKFEIIDSYSNSVKQQTTDPDLLGKLDAFSSRSLGGNISSVYKPIMKWYFTYEGNEYSIQHQYE